MNEWCERVLSLRHMLLSSVAFTIMSVAAKETAAASSEASGNSSAAEETMNAVEQASQANQANDEQARRRGLLEEIVVTTTRREVGAQDVGIALTAFTGDQLDSFGVDNAGQIVEVAPNMSLDRPFGAKGFNTQITIRGIGQPDFGDNTESTVTSYVDEFYLISQGTQDFLLHDIGRVEVARGPQGTLQGRNSTAGSINYFTNKPAHEFDAKVSGTFGRFDQIEAEGVLNVPFGKKWALRLSGALNFSDNFEKNINPDRLFNGQGEQEFQAARAILLYEPTSDFRLYFTTAWGDMGPAASQTEQSLQVGVNEAGTKTIQVETDILGFNEENSGAGSDRLVNEVGPNFIDNEMLHFNARLEWDVNDSLQITTFGGWMNSEKTSGEDCDDNVGNICLFSNVADQENWQIESRANWTSQSGRLRSVAGFTYLEQTIDGSSITPLFFDEELSQTVGFGGDLLALTFLDQQNLQSWAVFGHIEYDLNNEFTVVGGLRFTRDDKGFDAFFGQALLPPPIPIPRSISDFKRIDTMIRASNPATTIFNRNTVGDLANIDDSLLNANVQLNWSPNDDILAYISYRRGKKSGGFITGNVGPGFPAERRPYGAETNNAYEIGLKSTLMNGRARLNTAAFFYDYNDLQNNSFIGITNVITNNNAIVYGGEIELLVNPVAGLDVNLAIGLQDNEVEDITNAQGVTRDRELPLAPHWTVNSSVRYERSVEGIRGDLWVQGSIRAQGDRWRDSLNNPSVKLESFVEVDGQIGYRSPDDRWRAWFAVENIFDSRFETTTVDLHTLGNTGEVAFNPPRWWSFTVEFSY